MIEVDYKKTLFRLMIFALANATVATTFSFLWVWQYHHRLGLFDQIDAFGVHWLWLTGFFAASFLSLRGLTSKALVLSLLCAIVLSFFLWLMVHMILAPMFDPWW